MIVLLAGLALQAAAHSPPPVQVPAECEAYKQAWESSEALLTGVRLGGPVTAPQMTPEIRKILDQREALALAMKATKPDFVAIDRLMRQQIQLSEAFADRLRQAKVTCDIAAIMAADPVKQRKMLDMLRPRTRAEIEEQRRNAPLPIAPPAPPAPPSSPRR